MCEQLFSIVVVLQNAQEKADLQKTKVNTTKTRKVHADGNKPRTGKNGGHISSSLGVRSVVEVRMAGWLAGRQADEILAVYNVFKISILKHV